MLGAGTEASHYINEDQKPVILRAIADAYVSTLDRKSTRLNSSHRCISYAVFCLKKKKHKKKKKKQKKKKKKHASREAHQTHT